MQGGEGHDWSVKWCRHRDCQQGGRRRTPTAICCDGRRVDAGGSTPKHPGSPETQWSDCPPPQRHCTHSPTALHWQHHICRHCNCQQVTPIGATLLMGMMLQTSRPLARASVQRRGGERESLPLKAWVAFFHICHNHHCLRLADQCRAPQRMYLPLLSSLQPMGVMRWWIEMPWPREPTATRRPPPAMALWVILAYLLCKSLLN